MKTKKIAVEDLVLDERCQARAQIDHDAVEEYRQAYERGDDLPPIEAYSVSGKLHVVDGFHRFPALVKAGKTFAKVSTVGSGTLDDAVMYATAVNQGHGVRRSNADKRRAVRMVFDIGHGADMSDSAIADHCAVSRPLVAEVRREFEAPQGAESATCAPKSAKSHEPKKRRKGKDGKTYPAPEHELPHESPPETAQPMPVYGNALKGAAEVVRRARVEAAKMLKGTPLHQEAEALKRVEGRLKLAVPVVCPKCSGSGCHRCSQNGWCTEDQAHELRKGSAA